MKINLFTELLQLISGADTKNLPNRGYHMWDFPYATVYKLQDLCSDEEEKQGVAPLFDIFYKHGAMFAKGNHEDQWGKKGDDKLKARLIQMICATLAQMEVTGVSCDMLEDFIATMENAGYTLYLFWKAEG